MEIWDTAREMVLSVPLGDTISIPLRKCNPVSIQHYVQKLNKEAGYMKFSFRQDRIRCEVRLTHNIQGEITNGRDEETRNKIHSLLDSLDERKSTFAPSTEYNITSVVNMIHRENHKAGYTLFSFKKESDGCWVTRNVHIGY